MPGEFLDSREEFKWAEYPRAKITHGEIFHAIKIQHSEISGGKITSEKVSHGKITGYDSEHPGRRYIYRLYWHT